MKDAVEVIWLLKNKKSLCWRLNSSKPIVSSNRCRKKLGNFDECCSKIEALNVVPRNASVLLIVHGRTVETYVITMGFEIHFWNCFQTIKNAMAG